MKTIQLNLCLVGGGVETEDGEAMRCQAEGEETVKHQELIKPKIYSVVK